MFKVFLIVYSQVTGLYTPPLLLMVRPWALAYFLFSHIL